MTQQFSGTADSFSTVGVGLQSFMADSRELKGKGANPSADNSPAVFTHGSQVPVE